MRRVFAILLLFCLGAVPVRASETRYVALTFDDGPSGRYTRELLDGLSSRGARATFLLCGYRMQEYPELTERILEEGHEIGCHGYTHKIMEQMSRRAVAQEVMDCEALLPDHVRPAFLRPPGGLCGDGVRQVAEARKMAILGWSVDPRDWATENTAAIERSVLKNIRDGDIVLLHDMSASSVKAALDIIDILHRQGYRFVTVSELARLRGVRLKPGKTYTRFPPEDAEGLK